MLKKIKDRTDIKTKRLHAREVRERRKQGKDAPANLN